MWVFAEFADITFGLGINVLWQFGHFLYHSTLAEELLPPPNWYDAISYRHEYNFLLFFSNRGV